MRISVAMTACVVALALTGCGSSAVVLGTGGALPYGKGWGTAHPKLLDGGGDPTSKAWNIRWTNWGAETATGRGMTWSYLAGKGIGPAVPIEFRVSRIGNCAGHRSYMDMVVRTPSAPGRPLGRWRDWLGYGTACLAGRHG